MSRIRLAIVLMALVVLALGVYQVSSDSAFASNCPGGGGCGCSTAYAPVVCKGNCRYTNMCHAACAGFSSNQCKSINN
jgi:hypothetical protein